MLIPPTDTLRACNELLPELERVRIMEAAFLAAGGNHLEAEQVRHMGGYGYKHRGEDRKNRGLPDKLN